MTGRRGARCATALLALLLLTGARAQDAASAPEPDQAVPLSEEEQAALRDALNFDAPLAITVRPAGRSAGAPLAPGLDWKRTEKSDGSAAVTVKRPLPTRWESSLGADFGLAAAPAATTGPERPLSYGDEPSRGAAWASVKVPGLASIDARLGANDASRLGTTFSRSLPVGDNSVTLQNSYAVTETLAAMPATSPAPAPSAAAPVWSTERMVKFNILSTGTSFGAGTTSSSADSATHNKISAEQKLFDRLNVTTSVSDVGAPNSNKSITAGFKLNW